MNNLPRFNGGKTKKKERQNMSGYFGFSKSNNAIEAESNGRKGADF